MNSPELNGPVAWIIRNYPGSEGTATYFDNRSAVELAIKEGYTATPLYLAPPSPQPATISEAMIDASIKAGEDFILEPCDTYWTSEERQRESHKRSLQAALIAAELKGEK